MRERVRVWLAVLPGDWHKFSLFATSFFLLSAGIEFGRIGRDSYFLTEVGVESIPLMYVYTAILMVVSAPIYGRFVERISPDRLMLTLQVGGGVLLLLAWVRIALLPGPTPGFAQLVYPAVEAYLLYLLLHFWKFANAAFDAWEGKRLFPLIGGAGLAGALIAGITSRVLAGSLGANHLFAFWALALLATVPLTRRVGAQCLPQAAPVLHVAADQTTRFSDVMRQPLLRTLSYMALPMWIIIYIIEYSYFDAANRVFPDQDALAGFLGLVVSLSAAIGLFLQFAVTPRLLRTAGVGATCLVYPSTLTAGAMALLLFSLFPSSTASSLPLFGIALLVVFARLCDLAFFFSVHDSAQQLLFYAVPEALRDKARVLMHGVVAPLSMASAGGILMLFASRGEPGHNLAFVAIVLSFLLMVLGMSITPEYLQSLLAHLHPNKADERGEILSEIAKLESNDARYVLLQSITSDDLGEALFAIEHLFSIKDTELIEDILESGAKMRVEVVQDVARRMSDEEKAVHATAVTSALSLARTQAAA